MHKPFQYIPPKPPMWFNLFWPGIFGAILGFLTATGQRSNANLCHFRLIYFCYTHLCVCQNIKRVYILQFYALQFYFSVL